MEEETNQKSILEIVAQMADFANAVASMVVGHRKILVDGGFSIHLADQMASALHAQVLGLVQEWDDHEETLHVLEFLVGDDDEDDE